MLLNYALGLRRFELPPWLTRLLLFSFLLVESVRRRVSELAHRYLLAELVAFLS